jgi:hypothetical protein
MNIGLVLTMMPAGAAAYLFWRAIGHYTNGRWSRSKSIAVQAVLLAIIFAFGVWLIFRSESLAFGFSLGAGITPTMVDWAGLRPKFWEEGRR